METWVSSLHQQNSIYSTCPIAFLHSTFWFQFYVVSVGDVRWASGLLTGLFWPVLQSVGLPAGWQKHSKYAGHQLTRTQVRFNENPFLSKVCSLSGNKRGVSFEKKYLFITKTAVCISATQHTCTFLRILVTCVGSPSAFSLSFPSSFFISHPFHLEFSKA